MSRYLACARMQFATVLAYRADYLLSVVLLLVQVYLLRVVWTAVYADRGVAHGIAVHTVIAYATLATVQYTLFSPWRFSLIPQRVRDGQVAMDLLRPVGSGALVPLWFMPGPLRAVAQVLPFQATAYTPTATYLGEIHGSGLAVALGVQALWVGLLTALAALVWSRAVLRVVVQGG